MRRPTWRSAAQRCGVFVGGTANVPGLGGSNRGPLSRRLGNRLPVSGAVPARPVRIAVRCMAFRPPRPAFVRSCPAWGPGFLFDMFVSPSDSNRGYPCGDVRAPTLVVFAVGDLMAQHPNTRAG